MDFLPLHHLLLLIITCFPPFLQPLCHDDDNIALLEFKNSFNIAKFASANPFAYPKVSSWRLEENRDCCSWDGVECDTDTGRVVALDLSSSFLRGSMNSTSTLFNLSQLQRLNLADNNFNFSQIPSAMNHLSRLTYLNLSASYFYCQVPFEISQPSNLSFLDLSCNDLVLKSPNLSSLMVAACTVSSQMEFFYFETYKSLICRTTLILWVIYLNFNLTVLLRYQDRLRSLYLNGNKIHGRIPKWIWNISTETMAYLEISDNSLTGFEQPPVFIAWVLLVILDLTYNRLEGQLSIPPASTEEYQISNNKLSGEISPFFCNLSSLRLLDLSNNLLTGKLPQCFENFRNTLRVLNMSNNQFHGSIPQMCANGSNVRMMLN
nr:receptor-like protein 43 [Ziziphus jujuba var. spinosa]